MASKITKQDIRGCLSYAVLPRDCHNITCIFTKQEGKEMWLLWEEKVLIREI
jgi:hypothetical protein